MDNGTGMRQRTGLARVVAWLVALPLFLAGVITILLEFDITADPPRETPQNDLLEGTLEFFRNQTDRWPQEVTSLILFAVGFAALVGLAALLRRRMDARDDRVTLGTLAIGAGAIIGTVSQLAFIGAKQVGIDPHYCDCARAVEQIISRGQTLGMVERAQEWMVLGFLALAGVGLFLLWRAASDTGQFSATWRSVTVALAVVLFVGALALAIGIDVLTDVLPALGGAILTPVWALLTARELSPAGVRQDI